MLAFGGGVRVAPYATFGSRELADNVHAALEGRSAALMQNHGAVCFAGDCVAATELALLLEWACEVYWRARALGDPRVLSEEELAGVVDAVRERGYGQTPAK
jgi:L-fuculose-phosphate aldolase